MSKKINRNDPCWCGSGRKYKVCHEMFDDKIAKIAHQGHIVPTHNLIKNAEQIEKIKESAKINIAVLDEIQKTIKLRRIPIQCMYFRQRSGLPRIPITRCYLKIR